MLRHVIVARLLEIVLAIAGWNDRRGCESFDD